MDKDILDQELVDNKKEELFKTRPLIIWGFLLVLGILFQILQWPYHSILILVPSAGIQAYSLSGLLKPKVRNTLNITLSILGVFWLLILITQIFSTDRQMYNGNVLSFYSKAFTIYFLFYFLFYFKKKKNIDKNQTED